jgi:hypothetical protein
VAGEHVPLRRAVLKLNQEAMGLFCVSVSLLLYDGRFLFNAALGRAQFQSADGKDRTVDTDSDRGVPIRYRRTGFTLAQCDISSPDLAA